jgi:hypothetical protein
MDSAIARTDVKLSGERNAVVPAPLRNGNGWYEEDCESYIVGMVFPGEFDRTGDPEDVVRERMAAGVKWQTGSGLWATPTRSGMR